MKITLLKVEVPEKMSYTLQILFIIAPMVFAIEENVKSAYSIVKENKRITNQTFKTVGSSSLMSCSQACLRQSWCTSTNYDFLKRSSEGNCEQNKHKVSSINDDIKLTDESGTTFTMFLKGCLMTGCLNGGSCSFNEEKDSFSCSCKLPWSGENCERVALSCSDLKKRDPTAASGNHYIDPDGEGDLVPFSVYCDMTYKNGVGVTVISHDSENRTYVRGYEASGSYSRDIHYSGVSLSQLASLTRVSSSCEQFIKYECYHSKLFKGGQGWWVSHDSFKMGYWGGASPGSGKCACGMTNSCADSSYGCNCDKNDKVLREDSGLLTDKTKLPVKQLRFGDTGHTGFGEYGYHTLGKLQCYGVA